jgi:nucleoside-triphosphatase THEP1
MNAQTKEQFPMEAVGDEERVFVGRFHFSKLNFEKAIQVIHNAITKKGWLVIDEIGPLELKGEGFCRVLKEALAVRKEKILLIVREGMAEQVKIFFNIDEAEQAQHITALKNLLD